MNNEKQEVMLVTASLGWKEKFSGMHFLKSSSFY